MPPPGPVHPRHPCALSALALAALAGLAPWTAARADVESRPPAAPPPRVLVLASYHRGQAWTDGQVDGALEVLQRRWPEVDPVVEYLDRKRAGSPAELAARLRELERRLAGGRFDGVVTADDAAFEAALGERGRLFKGAAIAFSGVNAFDAARLVGQEYVTGVTEDVDVAGTFATIQRLQPDVRTILVVLDRTETSAGVATRVRQAAGTLGQSVGVRVEADRTLAELEGLVAGLDRRTAVLVASFTHDRAGAYTSYEQVAERLAARSAAPLYGLWDFQLGHGIVGGRLMSAAGGGRRAAEQLVAMLDGAPTPPVEHGGAAFLGIDHAVAQRFHLDEGRLGEAPLRLVNPPDRPWARHQGLVLGVSLALLALLAFSGVLLEALRRTRRTEQQLRESEERFRSIVDSVDDAIFLHDPASGAVLDVNRRACEMYRTSREAILRDGVASLSSNVKPHTEEDARRWMRRAQAEGPQRFEWHARRSDGTLFWVEVAIRPATIGGLVRLAVTVRDLTGLREAARALQQSEQRFRELADLLPQVVFETDATGRLTFVNRAAYQAFGYTPADVARGVDVRQFVVPEQRDLAGRNIGRLLSGGPTGGNEYLAMRKDGTTFPALTYSAPVVQDGRGAGVRGIMIDVTDRKRAEEERAAMQGRIEEGQRLESIGRLAGGVAHDFNNLLTPILGNAQAGLESLPADHPAAADLRAIEEAAQRASALTRQLLAFSRRQVLEERPLDLNAEVAALHALVRRVIGEDVLVRLALAPTLGRIRGDASQLQQALLNLAVNARDAMPGGGTLTIATRDVPAAQAPRTMGGAVRDLVELSVSDTGVGMTEELRAHVFEPFFTTKGPGQGSGLGLATVLGVVQQHGGDVEVESAPGRGTTFRLLFPRDDGAPLPVPELQLALTPAPVPVRAAAPLRAAGRTVLVAEDEPAVRRLVEGYLRGAGFQVLSAPDGPQALDLAGRHQGRIDLLLSDVVMPGMNGRELHLALTANHPGVPVLYMSGYPALPGSQKDLVDGARDAFVPKPFTRAELLARIGAVLPPAA